MKDYDFKSQYYIVNIPWQRNLDYSKIPKFNIRYNDTIVFHYDMFYSIFKVGFKVKGYNKNIFVAVINACLRYHQIIKKLYPYNKICVVIHVKENVSLAVDFDTLKAILNIIPNFAVCNDTKLRFDEENYKHIYYGTFKQNLKVAEKQDWYVTMGKLLIK